MDPGHSLERIRRISVVAPMRDEAEHVESFVADLAAQDFEGEIEVIVADGSSADGSPELMRQAAERAKLDLRVIDNPDGWVSHGLNVCVAAAKGDLIIRLDCHARYSADYLRLCARASEETGAWNVGGTVIPEGETPMERAVACAMDNPFGGIGWTRAASASGRVEVDTVTYGAFRPEVFRVAGLFDEALVRNQDDEFNLRLRLAGGRIVLDPRISVRYRPRGSLRGVVSQYYQYGLWKAPVMRKHRQVLGLRSLAPVAMVGSLTGLGLAASASAGARKLLAAELALYVAGAVGFGIVGLRKRDEPLDLLPRVAATFPAFHLAYGIGMAHGWIRGASGRRA